MSREEVREQLRAQVAALSAALDLSSARVRVNDARGLAGGQWRATCPTLEPFLAPPKGEGPPRAPSEAHRGLGSSPRATSAAAKQLRRT